MALIQSDRLIRMTNGPLGDDEVVVTSFAGREAMSRLFSFQVEFISSRLDLKPKDIIGKEVGIELDRRDSNGVALSPRVFHGYFNKFAAGSAVLTETGTHKYRHYRAEIVPWLWFLTQTARCYLFFPEKEEKSIFEVIEAVFARAKGELHVNPTNDLSGIADLKKRKVKHCVQYRETDFDFVSRTMEQYGVFYYFEFAEGKHTLILDMKKNYAQCEESEVFIPSSLGSHALEDHVTDWQHGYDFVSGKWTHTDYNFEEPAASLLATVPKLPAIDLPPSTKYEVYDYPGEYAKKADGDVDARTRQEEEETPHNVVEGSSTCKTFTPGHIFTLTDPPDEEATSEKGSYVLTAVTHTARQPSDGSLDAVDAGYNNQFTCIPDSVQFRPERITPRPVISGVQTAVVVGPPGEEIYTNQYGEVRVQFYWDREGKKDGKSSCWIRVSSPWAGSGWGAVHTPRIGQEVVVEYLEGDPDRPLITGRVWNDEQQPPFGFPAGAVVSGIKSDTHKGDGYNELAMDDTAGNELIRTHAQFDQDTTVENDQRSTIHNNRTDQVDVDDSESVGNNQTLAVGVDRNKTVGSNETIAIGANRTSTVGGSESATVAMQRTHAVGINETIAVGGAQEVAIGGLQAIVVGAVQSTNVGANQSTAVAGNRSVGVGGNQSTNVGKNESTSVGQDESRSVGSNRTTSVAEDDALTVGKNYVLTAGDSITIKTGKAMLVMKKDGTIALKGKDLLIEGSGKIDIKASKDIVMKGKKILQN